MANQGSIDEIIAMLADIAENPSAYVSEWKRRTGRPALGLLPMNFPLELVHAAGALPVVVQESRAPITLGRSLLFEFYCGYSRSLVDQAATGQLAAFDGFLLVDHCVALLGAADAMRFELPEVPVYLAQFPASMDEATTGTEVDKKLRDLSEQLEKLCGRPLNEAAIAASIRLFNRNRQMQRRVYALRRAGRTSLTAGQLQAIVKSSMIMDIEEHTVLLETLIPLLEAGQFAQPARVKLHLSGHFCHAPRPELLEMIEGCGAVIVDDDLFTGFRFISTDVREELDPMRALSRWYFDRNDAVPCSTRAQKTVDWEAYLTKSLRISGADGIIILMAKFCEPHMLYFPELRKEFIRENVPFLLIETEREGLALEMLRTRVEALVERIRRPIRAEPATV